MRLFHGVLLTCLLAVPAYGQSAQTPVQRYGEEDKDKTPGQIESEKRTEQAYRRSLGNVPVAAPVDPWGGVRSEGSGKPAQKAAGTKRGPSTN